MRAHLTNPATWITAASLACSTWALQLLVHHGGDAVAQACVWVVLAGVLDLLDGRVARLMRRTSAFGRELDSLADLVGFGVAPAMIASAGPLAELGPVGGAVACSFALAAALRLARFNASPDATGGRGEGLSTTMAGGTLVSCLWASASANVTPPPIWSAVGVVALALLMVSRVPYRTFRASRGSMPDRLLLVGLLGVFAAGTAVDLALGWALAGTAYVGLGIVDAILSPLGLRSRPAPPGAPAASSPLRAALTRVARGRRSV